MAEESKIEMEDDQGNVMSAKTYNDLRAQGIIQTDLSYIPINPLAPVLVVNSFNEFVKLESHVMVSDY